MFSLGQLRGCAGTARPAGEQQRLVEVVREEIAMHPDPRPGADLIARGQVLPRARFEQGETDVDVPQRPDAQVHRRPAHEDVGVGIAAGARWRSVAPGPAGRRSWSRPAGGRACPTGSRRGRRSCTSRRRRRSRRPWPTTCSSPVAMPSRLIRASQSKNGRLARQLPLALACHWRLRTPGVLADWPRRP